jgi:hypothetical protein
MVTSQEGLPTVCEYIEIEDRSGMGKRFRQAIYCLQASEDRQVLCEFALTHTVFGTNLGRGDEIEERCGRQVLVIAWNLRGSSGSFTAESGMSSSSGFGKIMPPRRSRPPLFARA